MDRDAYVNMLKSTLLKAAVPKVISIIATRFPFFALPIINPIMGLVVGKVLEIFLNETEMQAFLAYTDFRVGRQAKAFSQAAEENYAIQRVGTPEQKAAAEAELIMQFKEFVRLSN